MSHYLNGLQLHEQVIGKDADYAVLLNNIGLVYSHLGDYKNAENYTLQALQIQRICGVQLNGKALVYEYS